ncbi:glycosyltransferase family 4 protein [Maribacter algicola]|uniref:Glycosyltransferase family 4 protein n=1 Tax=Meishania litoralis TaxID=3434685 RepID=A0ACC7LMD2_9FLAO
MKIVLLLSRIEQTGVTTHTLDLASGLVEKGHEVGLITGGKVENASQRVDDFYQEFKRLGLTIMEFETPRGPFIRRAVQSITSVARIISMLKKFNPQIIHCQSPYMTFIPWLMGKKFTTTIHILYLKRNFKFKNPNHLIAISNESYEFSKKVFGIADANITLIHHGVSDRFGKPVPDQEKKALKKRFQIDEGKIIVGYVGSISRRKGSDILVKSLKSLNEATKNKIHVIFLGGVAGSEEQSWLKSMIAEAGIDHLMTLVPFEDPKPFYDVFDVFVLPSRMESFPLVTIEAMMSGCCPVRSNTEGAYEQIDHGRTGLLFENENAMEFTNAIELLANDKVMIKKLGEQARIKAISKFTIPVMTEKTLKVYEKIMNY